MFNVVLVEPEIPQNTGNIARLCAAADLQLIIVGKPGFVLHGSHLKRAGLDYWEYIRIKHEPDLEVFLTQLDMSRAYLLTTKAKQRPYTLIRPQPGDSFLFGRETDGNVGTDDMVVGLPFISVDLGSGKSVGVDVVFQGFAIRVMDDSEASLTRFPAHHPDHRRTVIGC
jgi:tRNA (cytidine(34)-2'-O)-methyltransferase